MSDQEVDKGIQNTTSAVTASPDNTNGTENTNTEVPIQGGLPKLQKVLVQGVDDKDHTSGPLVFQSTTATAITTPDRSSDIESSGSTSKPLGGTATPFVQSAIPNALRMGENVPSVGGPSVYLQQRRPIRGSGKPNRRTSTCVPKFGGLY
jgi:hypothetical protein